MAYVVMAEIVRAYILMACIVVACIMIVVAYIATAYLVNGPYGYGRSYATAASVTKRRCVFFSGAGAWRGCTEAAASAGVAFRRFISSGRCEALRISRLLFH